MDEHQAGILLYYRLKSAKTRDGRRGAMMGPGDGTMKGAAKYAILNEDVDVLNSILAPDGFLRTVEDTMFDLHAYAKGTAIESRDIWRCIFEHWEKPIYGDAICSHIVDICNLSRDNQKKVIIESLLWAWGQHCMNIKHTVFECTPLNYIIDRQYNPSLQSVAFMLRHGAKTSPTGIPDELSKKLFDYCWAMESMINICSINVLNLTKKPSIRVLTKDLLRRLHTYFL